MIDIKPLYTILTRYLNESADFLEVYSLPIETFASDTNGRHNLHTLRIEKNKSLYPWTITKTNKISERKIEDYFSYTWFLSKNDSIYPACP
jgi:hypothetical protein